MCVCVYVSACNQIWRAPSARKDPFVEEIKQSKKPLIVHPGNYIQSNAWGSRQSLNTGPFYSAADIIYVF